MSMAIPPVSSIFEKENRGKRPFLGTIPGFKINSTLMLDNEKNVC